MSSSVRRRVEMEHHVHAAERVNGELAHPDLHQVGRVKESGEIVKDVLRVAVRADPDDRQAGGLGARAHDGQVLADEGVEQRRLADVGRAGQGDVTAPGHAVA